jgi:uncharacterized protein
MMNPAITRGWLRAMIYVLALILIIVVFGMMAFFTIVTFTGKAAPEVVALFGENIFLLVIYQAIILAGVTALTLVFRRFIDRKEFVTLGFQKFRASKDLVLGLVSAIVMIALGFTILYLSGNLFIEGIRPDYSHLAGSLILCLMISWAEELSFRAYILNNLMDSFHPYWGLVISSVLFAAFHIFNAGMAIVPFINIFLAGILLGIVFIYTRTIWFALSFHFSWNFFQGPVFGFPVSGVGMDGFLRHETRGDDLLTGGDFGFEGSLLCSLLIILCIFALNHYYNKPSDKVLKNSPDKIRLV